MKGKYITLAGLLLVSCVQTQGKDFYADRIKDISNILVTLNTHTKAINSNDVDEPYAYEKKGSGFVVGNYVLTADHVVSRYSVSYMTPFGEYHKDLDRIEEKTFIDDLQIYPVMEDKNKDIAIFDLKQSPELCKTYCNDLTLEDLATSEELYQGLNVFWIASPQLRGDFYRSSHISAIKEIQDFEEKGMENFLGNSFSLNLSFRSGTSGRPVWAEIDGHKKIIGVGHYQFEGLGFAKLMDEYLEVIKDYEEGNLNGLGFVNEKEN